MANPTWFKEEDYLASKLAQLKVGKHNNVSGCGQP